MNKRLMDVLLALSLILFLAPVFVLLILLVRYKLGTTVLFEQNRVGLEEKVFTLYKFRTMTSATDKKGKLLPDSVRLTPFGIWLRQNSLDELPQLFNVLKGDMSFVGPRPLLVDYLPLYSEEQARRHLVKPGITGWAQVNGRNAISWQEKFKLDIWYVDNRTFWLDIKILWLTFVKVLRREGISQSGHVTMERFRG